MMKQTDTDKITKAISETLHGNTDAYTVIVTTYMQKLYRTARYACKNDTEAEDLVQETLIDGYLHLSSLREPEKIESWLMRILKNKAFNHLARARRREVDEIPDTLADLHSPESLYITDESMHEWKKRLDSLSPTLRETALLYFWDKLPMAVIAERTKTPLGTVKRRIHDAREKLKKEKTMTQERHTLPDAFAETVAAKIKELENYTKTYGSSDGFDTAYTNIKELISNLSYSEDVKTYSVKSAEIALRANRDKYAEETLAVFRRYEEVKKASDLLLDICWKSDDSNYKLSFTRDTILPTLAEYPDSEAKFLALGYHLFWMAHYTDKSLPEGIAEARSLLNRAMDEYAKTTAVNASYANTISALKALDILDDDRIQRYLLVTGETWKIEDGNLYLYNEPGCNYSGSNLNKYHNYIFMNAGYSGDRYFFPRTTLLTEGAEEEMINSSGEKVGIRRVVSLGDTVETPAGVFTDCLHLEKIDESENHIHIWYKNGVGLVKISIEGDMLATKVLASYEICGGEGWLPLAPGNKWLYENPVKPDFMFERNEYVIERMGKHPGAGDSVCVSALNYISLEKDWKSSNDDPLLLFALVDDLCNEKRYPEAAEKLRTIVVMNRSRESVDIALSMLEYLDEKLPYDAENWRFCPSSVNFSSVELKKDKISYKESAHSYYDTGVWGSRHEENRIFGVKPFRYLQGLCYTLWDERWVPGYNAEYKLNWESGETKLNVDNGGSITTPAGTFEDTVHLTVSCSAPGNPENYSYYFYDNVHCGIKEYWFAKGVGVVRFKCTWGHHLSSDCLLTDYHTVSAPDEMMPIHIGNRWRYEEQLLTAENYIARRDYRVLSGIHDRYLLADHQMFTWRGSVEEYEEWKKTL